MADFNSVLKSEIRRLARKEIRSMYPGLKTEIASLKRLAGRLNKKVEQLDKLMSQHNEFIQKKKHESLATPPKKTESARMSPKLILKLRKRLKLPRNEFAKLAGVTSNTIYLWEKGKVAPSKEAKAKLVGMRELGIREAREMLKA